MLKMNNLVNCFNNATKEEARYIAVKIETEGYKAPEIIVNPLENYLDKLEYYKKAYTEDLHLKTYKGIKITGFTFGDNLDSIEADLL